MNQDANFFFLDESHWESPPRTSLTGVVVPLTTYPAVRSAFYESLEWSITEGDRIVRPHALPELHASRLLTDEPDDRKIEQLRRVVDIVVEHALVAVRVTCSRDDYALEHFRSQQGALSLCWFQMLQVCQPLWEVAFLIPVVDGLDRGIVRRFSTPFQDMFSLRSIVGDKALSIQNLDHIAEVFYADSKYSACIQIADTISYLRETLQKSKEGTTQSAFRRRMLPVAARLDRFVKELDGTIPDDSVGMSTDTT